MGIFFRPRRPLLRLATGAATAAVAYHAGQRRSDQQQVNEQAEAAYQSTQQPAGPMYPAPSTPSGQPDDQIAQLERLSRLHDSGALDDSEFSAAKAQLLGVR